MHASYRRTVAIATLAVVASVFYAAPSGAMGRSSVRSVQSPSQTADCRTAMQQENFETALKSQVEALRQELAALKVRVELQGVASAE